jgi:hypothetical protein
VFLTLTTIEYPNCAGTSTGDGQYVFPDRAFVCCKDRSSSIRQRVVEFGCSLVGLVVLPAHDNQTLNTWDAVVRSLPPTIRLLLVDDVEYLLPSDQRNAASVLRLIGCITAFAAERGICASVSTGIDLLHESAQTGAM